MNRRALILVAVLALSGAVMMAVASLAQTRRPLGRREPLQEPQTAAPLPKEFANTAWLRGVYAWQTEDAAGCYVELSLPTRRPDSLDPDWHTVVAWTDEYRLQSLLESRLVIRANREHLEYTMMKIMKSHNPEAPTPERKDVDLRVAWMVTNLDGMSVRLRTNTPPPASAPDWEHHRGKTTQRERIDTQLVGVQMVLDW